MEFQATYESQMSICNVNPMECHQNLNLNFPPWMMNSGTSRRYPNRPQSKLNFIVSQSKCGPDLYVCPICRKPCSQSAHLVRHVRFVHGIDRGPEVPCPDCDKTFPSKQHMQTHRGRVHKGLGPSVLCHICGKTLKGQFDYHMRMAHTREFDFYCESCGKGYVSESLLKYHRSLKHAEKPPDPLKCPENGCGKTFKGLAGLRYHQEAAHPKKAGAIVCPECGKSYKHIMMYKIHQRRTHKENHLTYPCKVCGKVLTSRQSWLVHMRTHSGEKPFECEHCEKRFSSVKYLRVHRVVHTKERPHKCTGCDKSFTQRGTLSAHMKKFHSELFENK